MAKKPLVSVVMPVFNGEDFVEEAIASILAQTLGDFEFIIVDDASTDGTPALLAGFSDPRIRLHRNARRLGVAESLNRGIAAAAGAYVARMDADDLSLPQRLARQVAFLEAHPGIGLVGSFVEAFGEVEPTVWKYPTEPDQVHCRLLFAVPLAHPSVVIRRSVLTGHNLRYRREAKKAEDYDLWRRFVQHAAMANLGEVLLRYRVHPGQESLAHQGVQAASAGAIRETMLRESGLNPTPAEAALHQRIPRELRWADAEELKAVEAWLTQLRDANRQAAVYPEPAFSQMLGGLWFDVVNRATGLGGVAWRAWRASALSGLARVSAKARLKLAIKCGIKRDPLRT